MKKFITIIIISSLLLFLNGTLKAQTISPAPPLPPTAGGASGTNNVTAGGGAPVGGGLFILLGLGAAYGTKKVYDFRKENIED